MHLWLLACFFSRMQGHVHMQGRTYLCKKLDLSSKVAVVRPADLKYYTKTRDFTDVYVVGGKTAYQKPKVCHAPAYTHS